RAAQRRAAVGERADRHLAGHHRRVRDRRAWFVLGPVAVDGKDVSAVKVVEDTQNGGGWQIGLTFDAVGAHEFADVTGVLAAQPSPTNQFAIVLDGAVVSHPYVASAVTGGEAVISGGFTEAQARRLAVLIGDRLLVPLRLTQIVIPQ
ncbi:hypothetical protein AB0O00_34100, partial [Kitasatospora sp. NPDC093558]